jgi:hypothetical protein
VHIVWTEFISGSLEILYTRSITGGASFGPIINLSNNVEDSAAPQIAVSGNNVHIVWHNDQPGGDFDILYRRSLNNGDTFLNIIKNLSDSEGGSPSIAAFGNNVQVAWEDDTPLNDDILYRRSTDGGTSFTEPIKNLSSNAGSSVTPALAAINNDVHVVWSDDTGAVPAGNTEIFYRRSTNSGSTFPNVITNLSNNSAGFSTLPAVAVSGANIAWHDDTPSNFETAYRHSANNGVTFDPAITNLSTNPGISLTHRGPGIAVSEST